MKISHLLLLSLISLSISACKSPDDQIRDEFKLTATGKALYMCVSTDGNLTVDPISVEGSQKAVNVELKKEKSISLQFAINKDLNQAKLIGASVPGEKKLTKLSLMIDLELMCGSDVAAQILPEAYKALSLMNMFR